MKMMIKQQNNKTENFKILLNIMLIIFTIITLSNIVNSVPSPQGIEGTIYHPDGLTEVFEEIPLTITNLETQEKIIAKTGIGTSGRYSIALSWENNPLIEIKVQNPYYENSTTITLEGMMRPVNLNINMDFGNVPPNITSTPITEAVAEYEYRYEVKSFDWNNDEITHTLKEAPENMSITSEGLITWTPGRSQFGNNTVIINASDGEYYDLQEYELYVYVIKESPSIISEPIRTVKRGELYEYEVEVIDEDYEFLRFEVFRGPEGMTFVDNVLTFQMNNSHEGEYIIIIDIIDIMDEVERQIFILGIIEPEISSRSEKEDVINDKIGPRIILITGIKDFEINNTDLVIKKISINNEEEITLEIKETNPLDEGVRTINTKAYKYFTIKPNKAVTEKTTITFSVNKKWLEENGLKPGEIVLKKYKEGFWENQYTKPLKEEKEKYLFEAETQGLSLFVITHIDEAKPLPTPIQISKIKTNYLFIGEIQIINDAEKIISLNEKQLDEINKKMQIKGLNQKNNETGKFETRIVGNKIMYYGSITGNKGDEITILLDLNKKEIKHETTIKDIINEENIQINEKDISKIKRNNAIIILFIITILIIFYVTMKPIIENKKNKNKKINKQIKWKK